MNDAYNPYDHPRHEWDGRDLVPRETKPEDIREAIDAARGDSIWDVVHIPVEEVPEGAL